MTFPCIFPENRESTLEQTAALQEALQEATVDLIGYEGEGEGALPVKRIKFRLAERRSLRTHPTRRPREDIFLRLQAALREAAAMTGFDRFSGPVDRAVLAL